MSLLGWEGERLHLLKNTVIIHVIKTFFWETFMFWWCFGVFILACFFQQSVFKVEDVELHLQQRQDQQWKSIS